MNSWAATLALASRTGNVSEYRGALAGRNRGPASLGAATSACLFEFGTGFLPPETGAPKGFLKTMSPRRDRKSETTTREKWPQKWLFLLASYQLRVSEDWLVADAKPKFPANRENN